MNTINPFVIISSDFINVLGDTLLGLNLPFTLVKGVYKGKSEDSLLVPLREWQDNLVLKELGRIHKQESILLVDANGLASLEYMDDYRSVMIGKFRSIDKHEIVNLESYTEMNGEYFHAS